MTMMPAHPKARRSRPLAWTAPGSAALVPALVVAIAALVTACGRKATEADCALILDRNVEVQMKAMNIADPTSIQRRKDEIREAMKGEVKECVGKRITDAMVACVQKAQTADEIDHCMR
jgi:hypothetical protein